MMARDVTGSPFDLLKQDSSTGLNVSVEEDNCTVQHICSRAARKSMLFVFTKLITQNIKGKYWNAFYRDVFPYL